MIGSYKEIADYIFIRAKRKKNDYYNALLQAVNNGREYFADILAKREGIADKKAGDKPVA